MSNDLKDLKNLKIKTRFAPSPTGLMHFGNVRTALFNYLYAAQNQGIFLLRVEDTDEQRSSEEHTQALLEDLRWLSLDWQEGPLFQSQRGNFYEKYAQELLQSGQAYKCFCSEELLKVTRKIQLSQGKPPRYPGTCRHLSAADIQAKEAAGEKPVLRFVVSDQAEIKFVDLVKGPQSFLGKDIGDFVIVRGDGSASFMFANIIDDALMGVTHALRGEDHLTNTPRQILLAQALKLQAPEYGHFPLILGPDHSLLSKRNGSRSIRELREEGFLPLGLLNYLAGFGHHYTEQRFRDLSALVQDFKLECLSTSPAHYDPAQLNFWQKEAAHGLNLEETRAWLKLEPQEDAFLHLVKPNVVLPRDLDFWKAVFEPQVLDYSTEAMAVFKAAGPEFFKAAMALLESRFEYPHLIQALAEQTQKKGKGLFMPLRLAWTGLEYGPELAGILNLLGPDKAILRLKAGALLC
ncbi:MAG: glutamate--tRNA ligase [Gammaproteobacteria bacterium]